MYAFCDSCVCMFPFGSTCMHDDRCTVRVTVRILSTCINVSVSTLDTALAHSKLLTTESLDSLAPVPSSSVVMPSHDSMNRAITLINIKKYAVDPS